MADHQLEPFENVALDGQQTKLQVFEKAVLAHEGHVSTEDSNSAPLPESYPYKQRMRRAAYEREKKKLQIELLKVQSWVKDSGQRIVSLFEGRDAAGKGGTIKRFMEHLNPRGARVVALEKPTTTERGQWYFQRYVQNLPTAGEMVFFDRSWYNRAGVERVMGFCEPNYTEAKNAMFFHTHTGDAPWTIIRSDDKKRARLNCIRYFLHHLDYPDKDTSAIGKVDDKIVLVPNTRYKEKTMDVGLD